MGSKGERICNVARDIAREIMLQNSMPAKSRSVVIAWHGLPYYAAQLLCHMLPRADVPIQVIGTPTSLAREKIEAVLGRKAVWVNAAKPLQWSELALEIPGLFIHTGWRYRGFNSLARAVKKEGGQVVAMIDNNRKNNFRQFAGALVFRMLYRPRIDAAWVPGRSGLDLMKFFGFPSEKVYTGFYGADPAIFTPGPPLHERPKQFVFVGQFIPRKAPDLLVRAFQKFRSTFPDWRLLLVGSGPLQSELRGESVEVLPFLPPEAVAQELRRSRFLILPSHEEHWGVVVHEAALSGCGLILSDAVGSRADLLDERSGYIFRAGNERELTRCLFDAANQSTSQMSRTFHGSIELAGQFGPEQFLRSFRQITENLG